VVAEPPADGDDLEPLSCREVVIGVGTICLSLPAIIGA